MRKSIRRFVTWCYSLVGIISIHESDAPDFFEAVERHDLDIGEAVKDAIALRAGLPDGAVLAVQSPDGTIKEL